MTAETIIDTEVQRRTFVATGTHKFTGPVLVDVVITAHESDTRPVIDSTYSVQVDGRHAFGGPERHLDERGLPEGFERLFLNAREIVGAHKRDAGGPGLDWCPTCGRRIRDFDEDGMEADDGQRWCQRHAPGYETVAALGLDRPHRTPAEVLAGLEADGILQVVELDR